MEAEPDSRMFHKALKNLRQNIKISRDVAEITPMTSNVKKMMRRPTCSKEISEGGLAIQLAIKG